MSGEGQRKENVVNYNFGPRGWSVIIISFLCYFNYVGITGDGMNLILPGFAGAKGFDEATLLAINTPTSMIAVLSVIVIGWFMSKKGIKLTISSCYIIVGILIVIWARVTSMTGYIIVITIIFAISVGYSHLSAGEIVSNWFVKKRSMAMGISSMGLQGCTCLFVPMLALLYGSFGFVDGFTIYGVVVIALGVASLFWVVDKPEMVGKYIDNDPIDNDELARQREAMLNFKTGWTFRKVIKVKEMWLLGVITGLQWLACMGFVAQIVPFLMSGGYSQTFSISMMSTAAICGAVSSWVWGLIDVKIGTQKTSIIFNLFFIIPFTLLIAPATTVTVVLAALTAGWMLGGHSTLLPAYTQVVFGRDEFGMPYKYIMTLNVLLKSVAFVILALSLNLVGDYRLAYGIFMVLCVFAAFLCKFVKDTKEIRPEDIK